MSDIDKLRGIAGNVLEAHPRVKMSEDELLSAYWEKTGHLEYRGPALAFHVFRSVCIDELRRLGANKRFPADKRVELEPSVAVYNTSYTESLVAEAVSAHPRVQAIAEARMDGLAWKDIELMLGRSKRSLQRELQAFREKYAHLVA